MKYARIIADVLSTPWAVLDITAEAIVGVLVRCEAGERFSEEQVREVVGEKHGKAEPFCVTEGGVRAAFGVEAAAGGGKGGAPKAVAVLPVYGIIAPRVSNLDISSGGTGIDQLTQQFRQALANPDVKAIVMDFDSPGGSVYGVDELAAEILAGREQKKIVAQVSPLCASAAYYLASQCSEIAIMPSGEVGSIGVKMLHQDISAALAQRGVKITSISAGKYKTEGSPYEPLGEDALAFMKQRVDDYYLMFINAVARGREVKAADVKKGFGEGRVVGAAEAKRIGMVDRVATMDETLARLGVGPAGSRIAMVDETPATTLEVANVTTATAENQQEVHMLDTTQTAAAGAAVDMQAERTRCSAITQLATIHKMHNKLAAWLDSGATLATVQGEILAGLAQGAVPIAQPAAEDVTTRAVARPGVVVGADEHDRLPKGLLFGRTVRAIAAAKGNTANAIRIARNAFGDPALANRMEAAAQTPAAASGFSDGGFIIPENMSTDVIELLRPMAVVRSLNPTLAPLVNGSLSMPKLTGGATATYVGENQAIKSSKVKGGQVKASAKKLATLIPISNDLLRFASISADGLVRDDMVRAMAQAEDLSFLRSPGTAFSPKGLRYWSNTSVASTLTTATIASNTDLANLKATRVDLAAMRLALRKTNRPFIRPGWIMSPRSENWLMFQVQDGFGNNPFRAEMEQGRLMKFPYQVTTQIPDNLGSGADSEIYLAEFADVVIADAPSVAVEVSNEASYDDGSGTLVSSFSNDQTVIRMINEHDLVMRHDETVIVMTGVEWA